MKLVVVALLLAACGSKAAPPASPAPAPVTEAPAEEDSGEADPFFEANMAATEWNMAQTGTGGQTPEQMAALVARTKEQLKLACDQGNVCACNALKTGNCECPDEPMCASEPFWFVSGE